MILYFRAPYAEKVSLNQFYYLYNSRLFSVSYYRRYSYELDAKKRNVSHLEYRYNVKPLNQIKGRIFLRFDLI